MLAEGLYVIEEAAASGHEIEALLVGKGFGLAGRENALLDRMAVQRVRVCRVSDDLLGTLSGVLSPQGAIALVRVAPVRIADVSLGPRPVILGACGVQDPGNLGTLLRTAAAFGATMVCATRGSVSPRNVKCVRSSAGAYFKIPFVENLRPADLLSFLDTRGIVAFRADARERRTPREIDLRGPLALLLGNESRGIPSSEFCNLPAVGIPMAAEVDSLNVAIAGGILLYETFRQRMEPKL